MPLLFWLDADQHRYLGLEYALLYVAAALAILPFVWTEEERALSSARGTALFFAVVGLALLAGRWAPLFVREALNIDEAGMLALADQMRHFPIPWVDYDPQTVGPLDAAVLNVPLLVGISPGWIGTRLAAIGITMCALGGLYATIALVFEARVARLAVIPPLLFFTTVYERDFLHYSSELLPMALTIWAIFLLLLAVRRRLDPWPVAGCAFIAGAMPFAKLQAAPIGLALFGLLVLALAGFLRIAWSVRWKRLLLAVGAAAVVPVVTLLPVAARGELHDFWVSYILSGINYIWWADISPMFVLGTPEFSQFFDPAALIALEGIALIVLFWPRLGTLQKIAPFVFGAVLWAALYAIYVPRHGSAHYLLLAAFPIASCAAYAVGIAIERAAEIAGAMRRRFATSALAVLFLIASCIAMPWKAVGSPYVGWLGSELDRPLNPTAAAIDDHIGKDARVAIWGWAPNMWVDSQTLMGTRDLLCQHQIDPGPYREYYRQRFLADFIAIKPAGFLDAVTPDSFGYQNQAEQGFESFPALAAVVHRDYVLMATIGKGFRIYKRR